MEVLRAGIDFGTTYTYIGFVHGTDAKGQPVIQLLHPQDCSGRGIPSLYYEDENQLLFGRQAELQGRDHPQCLVSSIKRRILDGFIHLDGRDLAPRQVIQKLFAYFLTSAEESARKVFHLKPDRIELVLTVPVDFDDAQIELLRRSVERVRLKSGTPVVLLDLIQEPVASAIRYSIHNNEDPDCVAVFDLGGGTLDLAVLRSSPDGEVPYEVLDLGGSRDLGGDLWDQEMEHLMLRKAEEQLGRPAPEKLRQEIRREARDAKEQLSAVSSLTRWYEVPGLARRGSQMLEISVTRQEFEEATEPLMALAVEELQKVLERQKNQPISRLLLTGGSSRMPQVEETLRSSGVLLPGMELSIYNPERSIVEGAALYAGMIQIPEIAPVRPAARPAQKPSARSTAPAPEPAPSPAQKERLIQRIAPHGYGVVCAVPERGGDPMIRILIRKGDPLPARAVSVSVVPNRSALARKRSLIRICETDAITESPDPEYPEEGTYITIGSARLAELWQGREIFEAELLRNIPAPVGARTVQILTLNEDLTLGLEVTDNFSGRIIRNQNITIRATSVDLGDGEE